MNRKSIIKKIQKRGVMGSVRYILHGKVDPDADIIDVNINTTENAAESADGDHSEDKVLKILLLTNRDSDNLGDLVIEACDISLIRTIMKNLKIPQSRYEIISRAAGIVNKKYIASRNPEMLSSADQVIQSVDMVLFGGAPLFNFKYQIFSERTAVTLELAHKYGKPAIFSALGVEGYDPENARCIHLKEALGNGCVKQITTRDDFASLQKYIEGHDEIKIGKVADPAVYCQEVFRKYISTPPKNREKKKVGIFVLRSGGFKSNGIDFSRGEAAKLWLGIITELENLGYDYELLTSGHFGDEAFLDYLIRGCEVNEKKCVFNISSPESLIKRISRYDGVISCRLHPSIISYSLGVPSVAIVWNEKVTQFYDAIGHTGRALRIEDASPESIAATLDKAIGEEYEKDEEFRMSVYKTMFDGISDICIENGFITDKPEPYTAEMLIKNMVPFRGTPANTQKKYMIKKMRRTYEHYNMKNTADTIEADSYSLIFNSGTGNETLTYGFDTGAGRIEYLSSGSVEYRLSDKVANTGRVRLPDNEFTYPGNVFVGWRMRVKNAGVWYWYMEDGVFYPKSNLPKGIQKGIIKNMSCMPYIPLHDLDVAVLEAKWEKI